MAAGKFMKSAGIAALVAGLAVLALPAGAQAQDGGHGRWNRGGDAAAQGNNGGGGNGRGNRDGGGWRGGDNNRANSGNGRGFRSEQSTAAPVPAPQAQVQAAPQRNWSRGDGNGGNRWRNSNTAQVAPAQPAQVQTERRNWSGNGSGNGDGQWRGQNRWEGRNRDNGDASRWNGNNDNRWRGDRQNRASNYARNWNRDWRSDNRYDWRGYRNSNRNAYRLGTYYAPYRNYSYRRLSAGFYLDTLFFGSRYWIDDPWQYRLPPADGPYRWIRYYDDALLVDTYTGEVVDTIYNFFW